MLLQVFIILSGNYNFFNLLTVTLCLSLLDDRHVYFWLRKAYKTDNGNDGMKLHCTAAAQAMFRRLRRSCLSRRMHILFYLNFLQTKRNIEDKLCSLSLSPLYLDSKLWSWLCYLLELVVWALLIVGTIICFDLQLDTAKKGISSRTGECFFFFFFLCACNQFCFSFFMFLKMSLAAFTYHQFNLFLKTVTIPCIWIGVLSLTWEMVTSLFR